MSRMIPRITTIRTYRTVTQSGYAHSAFGTNTSSTAEAFAVLVLTRELILLELLALREPWPLPPVILLLM